MSNVSFEIKGRGDVFLSGYNNFTVRRAGILTCPYPKLGARLEVDNDLSPLFPFINSTDEGARYFDNPDRIQFIFEGISCTLYPFEIIAAAFNDHDHAMSFGENLLKFLNNLHEKRACLKPDYRRAKHLSILDIYKILPGKNCGKCGEPSCLAFAGAVSKGRAGQHQCPGLVRPMEEKAVYPIVGKDGRLTGTIELDLPDRDVISENQSKLGALLTERELQVLKLLALGLTNTEIAVELFISPHTVKTHVNHIYEKLGVNDRAQASVIAGRHHLV